MGVGAGQAAEAPPTVLPRTAPGSGCESRGWGAAAGDAGAARAEAAACSRRRVCPPRLCVCPAGRSGSCPAAPGGALGGARTAPRKPVIASSPPSDGPALQVRVGGTAPGCTLRGVLGNRVSSWRSGAPQKLFLGSLRVQNARAPEVQGVSASAGLKFPSLCMDLFF